MYECYSKSKPDKSTKRPTLCWKCKNASNSGCSWSKRFKPVEGWDATPTTVKEGYLKDGSVRNVDSFNVHTCPKFIQNKR